ncbi:VOC family protein [Nocardia salmonicida]
MPIATLRGVTLDCADPRALARFYQELTGMQLGYDADDFVALTDGSGCDLGFQRVDGYRAPRRPPASVFDPPIPLSAPPTRTTPNAPNSLVASSGRSRLGNRPHTGSIQANG